MRRFRAGAHDGHVAGGALHDPTESRVPPQAVKEGVAGDRQGLSPACVVRTLEPLECSGGVATRGRNRREFDPTVRPLVPRGDLAFRGGRGLVRGRVFTRAGRLVASTAQEGLIRLRPPKA